MQANGAWDKALKPEKLGILSNAETKLDVVNAMADLMETTPLEKLTVSQICKTSGISRSSFYRCFEDKYAVAQWHIQFVHLNGVDQIGRTLSWYEGYFRTEADFVKYKRFYAGATKKSDYNTIDESIPRCRKETLIETIRDYHGKKLTTKLFFEIEALAAMEFKRCLGGTTTPSTRSRLSRNANGCANSSLVISSTCSTSLSSDK